MEEHEIQEQIARMRAELQQALAALDEMAGILGGFRRSLVDQGFSTDEAADLTRDFFDAQLRPND